ncbi:MAG: hypothetical protein AAGA30_15115 [Planctomycetota bacterium]
MSIQHTFPPVKILVVFFFTIGKVTTEKTALFLLLVNLLSLCWDRPASAQRIFYDTGQGRRIHEVDVNGGSDFLVYTASEGWQIRPIDATFGFAGRAYWIERTQGRPNIILSSRLDGNDVRTELTGLTNAWNIQVDEQNLFAYWMDIAEQQIKRATLDSNGAFVPGSTTNLIAIGHNNGGGLRLDLNHQKIYWAESIRIRVANLDGSGVTDFYNVDVGAAVQPFEIAIDAQSNVYWINGGLNGGTDAILRADPDGSNVQTPLAEQQILIRSLAVDKQAGHLYFSGPGIFRSNLDLSELEQISSTSVHSIDIPEPLVCLLGDVSGDGSVNLLDVAPFVERVISGEYSCEADTSQDGYVDLLDVQSFVDLLL